MRFLSIALRKKILALVVVASSLLLCAFGQSALAANSSAGTTSLTIHIVDLRNNQGTVKISLYNSASGYATQSKAGAYKIAALPIRNNQAVWQIKNLPPGQYSVLFFHDEIGTGVMEKNMLGIPKEGYGWSGGNGGKSKVPPFEQTSFSVVAGQNNRVTGHMLYW